MKKLFGSVFPGQPQNPMIGKTIQIQHHLVKVVKQIGEGGFSCIFEVHDVSTGDVFALKHLRLSGELDLLKEVQQEGIIMAKLRNHPNILRLHAMAFAGSPGKETDGFMLLDYCPKTLLGMMQAANFNLDSFFIYEVFSEVCQAVHHMHSQSPPLAHRDLKAENVLKNCAGRWVLCDFGSATHRAQVYETPAEIAMEEDNVRRATTPAYRAPEMWDLMTRQRIDTKVDIWALGVLLYVLVYGKLPFDGESKLSILFGKYTLPPGKPAMLVDLIKALLVTDPAQRPDINQVLSRLKGVREALNLDARSTPSPPRPTLAPGAATRMPPPSTQIPPATQISPALQPPIPVVSPNTVSLIGDLADAPTSRQGDEPLISTSPPRVAPPAAWPLTNQLNEGAIGGPTPAPSTVNLSSSGALTPNPGTQPQPVRPPYPSVPFSPQEQQQVQMQQQQVQMQQQQQQWLQAMSSQAPLGPLTSALPTLHPPTPGYPTLPPARVERSAAGTNSSSGLGMRHASSAMSNASSSSSLFQMQQQQKQQPTLQVSGSYGSLQKPLNSVQFRPQQQGTPSTGNVSPPLQGTAAQQQQQASPVSLAGPETASAPQQFETTTFDPDWGEEPAFDGTQATSASQSAPPSAPQPAKSPPQPVAQQTRPASQNQAVLPQVPRRASPPLQPSSGKLPRAASPTRPTPSGSSAPSAVSRPPSSASQASPLARLSADPQAWASAASGATGGSTGRSGSNTPTQVQQQQQQQQTQLEPVNSLRTSGSRGEQLSKAVQEEHQQQQCSSEISQLRYSLQAMTTAYQSMSARVQQLEDGAASHPELAARVEQLEEAALQQLEDGAAGNAHKVLLARLEHLEEAAANQVPLAVRVDQLEGLVVSQAAMIEQLCTKVARTPIAKSSSSSSSSSSQSGKHKSRSSSTDQANSPRGSVQKVSYEEGGGGVGGITLPEDHHW